jgi:serine phosphatase RsbU (regulator of sigma subunit)
METGMADSEEPREIACMEVWGGNGPTRTSVSVPGNDVSVAAEPWRGGGAGGDIYYMSNCMAGIITRFVLADVAGHGEGTDELARSLRRMMRKHINTADQSRFARALNREFGEASTLGRFATALIATYFAPSDHLIVCNAGHPSPLWYRAAERRWMLMGPMSAGARMAQSAEQIGVPNLPLGIIEPTSYAQFAVRLEPGDAVVMYTDALMEAKAGAGTQLGEAGLLGLAADAGLEHSADMAGRLLELVRAETDGQHLDDDATVLAIRHHGGDPPRISAGQRMRALGRLIGLQ